MSFYQCPQAANTAAEKYVETTNTAGEKYPLGYRTHLYQMFPTFVAL
jgi:hypothetical protein